MKASILFLCYNQASYVCEAIRSAMAQDYGNLELVVCDDGSVDDTRAIIEKELKNCPPHITVVYACPETNIGLLANFNQGMAACSGDVVFAAAGDDISMPDRVSTVMEVFGNHLNCMMVSTNFVKIDDNGQLLATSSKRQVDEKISYGSNPKDIYAGTRIPGASAAYRCSLVRIFGPLNLGKHAEDGGYWVRALLAGEVHYLAKPLVKYRVHTRNLSNYAKVENSSVARLRYLKVMLFKQHDWRQYEKDIFRAVDEAIISREFARHLCVVIRRKREKNRLKRLSIAAVPWPLWFASARRVMACHGYSPSMLWEIIRVHFRMRASEKKRARRWKQKFINR